MDTNFSPDGDLSLSNMYFKAAQMSSKYYPNIKHNLKLWQTKHEADFRRQAWTKIESVVLHSTSMVVLLSTSMVVLLLFVCVHYGKQNNSQIYGRFLLSQIDVKWRAVDVDLSTDADLSLSYIQRTCLQLIQQGVY